MTAAEDDVHRLVHRGWWPRTPGRRCAGGRSGSPCPTTVQKPATVPMRDGHRRGTALSETPTASVHDFGTPQADDVAEEHEQDAEVEQRAAPAAAAGARRAGTSGWSSRTCRSGSARCGRPRRPRGRCRARPPTAAMSTSALTAGSSRSGSRLGHVLGRGERRRRPTSSSGGPSAASRRDGVAVVAAQRRQRGARPRRRRAPHGEPRVAQRQPQQLEAGAVLEQQPPAAPRVAGGGELQHDARGGRAARRRSSAKPGAPVGLLEPQQRHAALAGVAVGEVGQVQAAAPAEVEGLDVVGRPARAAGSRPRWSSERAERLGRPSAAARRDGRAQQRQPGRAARSSG